MKSKKLWFVIGVLVFSNALTAYGLIDRSVASDDLVTSVSQRKQQVELLETMVVAFSRNLSAQEAAEIIGQERSGEIIKRVDDQTLEVGAVTLRFEGTRLTEARAW